MPQKLTRSRQAALLATAAIAFVLAAVPASAAPRDKQPPSVPQGMAFTGVTTSTIGLRWDAATDNRGVAGYSLYRNGNKVGTTTGLTYTFTSLSCGTSYTVALEAFDAARNASNRAYATGTTSTAACATDVQPPSTPGGLVVTGSTADSLSIGWSASTDDAGVAGYGIYRDGAAAGTTSATSYTFAGLACGTSYGLAADAFDAAGNRSGRASVTGSTAECGPAGAAVFVSPAGSDISPCTAPAPCRSFDRAYRAASPGALVQVAGGTYVSQQINADATKTSAADVVFAPAAGETVTLGGLRLQAKHLEVRDMTLSGWELHPGTDDVTLRNLNVRGGIFIFGATNVSIVGGSVGPGVDYHPQFAPWPVGSAISNIVIDGVDFHDWTRTSTAVHTECLQIAGGNGITIRNSTFRNCAVMDLSITEYNGSGPPTNYTIENNVFAPAVSGGYYSLQFNSNASALRDILIRNNSSAQSFLIDNGQPTISNVRVVANVAPIVSYLCSSRVTYARNVWQGAACSSSDRNAPSGFRNPAALDYHLSPGAAAIDAGDPASFPANDMDGQARPMGGMPDAGADEAS